MRKLLEQFRLGEGGSYIYDYIHWRAEGSPELVYLQVEISEELALAMLRVGLGEERSFMNKEFVCVGRSVDPSRCGGTFLSKWDFTFYLVTAWVEV